MWQIAMTKWKKNCSAVNYFFFFFLSHKCIKSLGIFALFLGVRLCWTLFVSWLAHCCDVSHAFEWSATWFRSRAFARTRNQVWRFHSTACDTSMLVAFDFNRGHSSLLKDIRVLWCLCSFKVCDAFWCSRIGNMCWCNSWLRINYVPIVFVNFWIFLNFFRFSRFFQIFKDFSDV